MVVFSSSSPGRFTVKATSRLEEPGQYQVDRNKRVTVSTRLTVLESLRITNLVSWESPVSVFLVSAQLSPVKPSGAQLSGQGRPLRRFFRKRRPYRTRFNFIANPYFAF